MHNCLLVLAVATALTTSTVARVASQPLTLINCAGGSYQAILDDIRPGAVAAGVVMADAGRARLRAEQVLNSSVTSMIADEDANAIVLVTKAPVRVQRGDATCVVFTGEAAGEPLPPTTWANQRK